MNSRHGGRRERDKPIGLSDPKGSSCSVQMLRVQRSRSASISSAKPDICARDAKNSSLNPLWTLHYEIKISSRGLRSRVSVAVTSILDNDHRAALGVLLICMRLKLLGKAESGERDSGRWR